MQEARRAQVTAVLGSFIAVDKLLRSWATSRADYVECDFDIHYLDGFRISGVYPMWQKCTTRQSLGAYVRRQARALQGSASHPDFLASDETADFPELEAQ